MVASIVGVVKTCGSFTEVKKPEHAVKLFVRFAIAKGVVTYGPVVIGYVSHLLLDRRWC